MGLHHFMPKAFHNVMGGHEPVLEIESGDQIRTETVDAHGIDRDGKQRAAGPNPLVGPFSVAGARPGDSIEVSIEAVLPNRSTGWSRRTVAPHLLSPELLLKHRAHYVEAAGSDPYLTWTLDQRSQRAFPGEEGLADLSLPLQPMLGCIGTAPPEHQVISTATSGPSGGNMDYIGIREGMTLQLPVYEPGGLLYFGDGHAAQGVGEIGGTGIETSMDVQLRVELRQGVRVEWPRGSLSTHVLAIGNARPLEQALQFATSELLAWLTDGFGIEYPRAALLLAQACEYHVGNVFDPAYTMVCLLSRRYLPT